MMRLCNGPFGLLITLFSLTFSGVAHATFISTHGNYLLYLSTGPGANGGGSTGTDLNSSGSNESDAARARFAFSGGAGGVFSFTYNVLTSEFNDDGVQDIFIVSIDDVPVLRGGVDAPGASGDFPPVGPFTGPGVTGPDGSEFPDGELGPATFEIPVSPGPHIVEFEVLDDLDDLFDTALLVDKLALDDTVIESFEDDVIGSAPGGAIDTVGNVTVVGRQITFTLPQPTTLSLLLMAYVVVTSTRSRRSQG